MSIAPSKKILQLIEQTIRNKCIDTYGSVARIFTVKHIMLLNS